MCFTFHKLQITRLQILCVRPEQGMCLVSCSFCALSSRLVLLPPPPTSFSPRVESAIKSNHPALQVARRGLKQVVADELLPLEYWRDHFPSTLLCLLFPLPSIGYQTVCFSSCYPLLLFSVQCPKIRRPIPHSVIALFTMTCVGKKVDPGGEIDDSPAIVAVTYKPTS
ncbi:hypothetical protein PoB_001913900 [Plakobranchus ocellatus]|uniref:Uncharacterized protein n=1 Tax=Plakobranchus ocellatus TaxID=259542 RepID=A0AAV3ZFH5_9GAST|nr:hypothetical protein PoB_001913900 [Plakobranchus ocellatus]